MLEECPLWAVQEAGKAWRRKKAEPPTPAEWLADSRKLMGWYSPCIGGEMTGRVYEKLQSWMTENQGKTSM